MSSVMFIFVSHKYRTDCPRRESPGDMSGRTDPAGRRTVSGHLPLPQITIPRKHAPRQRPHRATAPRTNSLGQWPPRHVPPDIRPPLAIHVCLYITPSYTDVIIKMNEKYHTEGVI